MYSLPLLNDVDWSSIAAWVNCTLLVWLIAVTIKYVKVNAQIAASNRGMLHTVAQQLRDSRAELAGPVLAAISDELRFLQRWLAWTSDEMSETAMLSNQEAFVVANYDAALYSASRISIDVYNQMTYARERICLFESWIQRERSDIDRDAFRAALNGMRGFLVESSEQLALARDHVQNYLSIADGLATAD
ncbi:MAG: hypothetical protein QOI58_4187 [Thermoanaerobaculia bacterium]|nr:hypothetical protein [Thermoanaerobaculia bacterium]